jgi:enamine deaminase RidA (YjgF/YER057c/UK114 family)
MVNSTSAEDRLIKLGIHAPKPPTPFDAYVPAVQTGNLLFLSGMLATSGHTATVVGVVGKDLDVKAGREAAYTATLNMLALTEPEAYRRDVPKAQVHVLDSGHFALDTAADEIADLVRRFLSNKQ